MVCIQPQKGDQSMADENGGIRTGEQIYLQIFRDEDNKAKKELTKEFLNGFLAAYGWTRKKFSASGNAITSVTEKTLESVESSKQEFTAFDKKRHSALENSKSLGKALGFFLAAVDYGVVDPLFNTRDNAPLTLIMKTREIALRLKMLDQHVNQDFIRKHITALAKKHRGKLSEKQQTLLAQLAAVFD